MKMKNLLAIASASIIFGMTTSFGTAFVDTKDIAPAYENAINEFAIKGVVSGYPDETFRPVNTITRAEAAKIIVTAFELKIKDNSSFVELSDAKNSWAEEYINIVVSNGAITGYEDGTFRPSNTITYGELSAILTRLLGAKVEENKTGAWWVPYIEEAKNIGIYKDVVNGNAGDGENKVRRDDMVLMVWNATKYEKPAQTPTTEEKEDPSKEEQDTQSGEINDINEIDTNKIYFGTVDRAKLRRGQDYVDVNNFNDAPFSIKVKNIENAPEEDSVLFYKVRKSKSVTTLKELKLSDLKDAYVIEELDEDEDGVFKIKGQSVEFDISEDDYTFDEKMLKLGKANYIVINVGKNKKGNYEFKSGAEVDRFSLDFNEGDRIVVAADKRLFILIKGLKLNEEL